MPNLNYQLTLQSEGINSGPYYNVTYASSSTPLTYFPVLGGSPTYLPNVGSTANVQVPSQSYSFLQFNLNNGSGSSELCNNNVTFLVTGSAPTLNSGSVYMNSFVDYPYGYVNAATACSLGGYTGVVETVYWSGTIGNGTNLYFDTGFSNAFDADGTFGWYWISSYRFQYSGGISSYASC
jgi:hypothetical protein